MPIMFEPLQKYLNSKRLEGCSEITLRNYNYTLKNLVLFCNGELSHDNIEAFLSQQKITRVSLGVMIGVIKRYTSYLFLRGLEKIDHGVHFKSIKVKSKPRDCLTEDEFRKLLKTVSEDETKRDVWRIRDLAIISLFLGTGVRLSELMNLKLEDVSVIPPQIRVTRKGGNIEWVPYGLDVGKVLQNWLEKRGKLILRPDLNRLFISAFRRPISTSAIQNVVKRWYARAGIKVKKISAHNLRHTYATHILNKGTPVQVVQDLLGHASLASTAKYVHPMESQRQKAAECFDM